MVHCWFCYSFHFVSSILIIPHEDDTLISRAIEFEYWTYYKSALSFVGCVWSISSLLCLCLSRFMLRTYHRTVAQCILRPRFSVKFSTGSFDLPVGKKLRYPSEASICCYECYHDLELYLFGQHVAHRIFAFETFLSLCNEYSFYVLLRGTAQE